MANLLRLSACLFLFVSLNTFSFVSGFDYSNSTTLQSLSKQLLVIDKTGGGSFLPTINAGDTVNLEINHFIAPLSYHPLNNFIEGVNITINGEPLVMYVDFGDGQCDDACSGGEIIGISQDSNYDNSIFEINQFYLSYQTFGFSSFFETTSFNEFFNYSLSEDYWDTEIQEYVYVTSRSISASPVPLPAGIYLFLSGLVGLGLMRGRNG